MLACLSPMLIITRLLQAELAQQRNVSTRMTLTLADGRDRVSWQGKGKTAGIGSADGQQGLIG